MSEASKLIFTCAPLTDTPERMRNAIPIDLMIEEGSIVLSKLPDADIFSLCFWAIEESVGFSLKRSKILGNI